MFCPKCGANLLDDMAYCPICGMAQHAGNSENYAAVPIPPVPPLSSATARRPKKKVAIGVIAVLLVFALLSGGIALFVNWKNTSASDPYYMSRCLLTEDGETLFDVSYTDDGKMLSFYCNETDAPLTLTYDQDGRVQTLTHTTDFDDSTYTYRFRYEEGRIPGTDIDGMIGADPSEPTLCLYYSQDNQWMGISAGEGNEYALIFDEQQRIQSLKIEGVDAKFEYDEDTNLERLQWSVSHSFVPLNSIAGDIVGLIGSYQIWSQFPDFTSFLLWTELIETSFTLQLQYNEGRLSGGYLISDDYFGTTFRATLDQISSTETSDSFNATVAGETLQFPITIRYKGEHLSEISVDVVGYDDEVTDPVPMSRGTFDEQGHEVSTTLFDSYYPGVAVSKVQKTWTLREK